MSDSVILSWKSCWLICIVPEIVVTKENSGKLITEPVYIYFVYALNKLVDAEHYRYRERYVLFFDWFVWTWFLKMIMVYLCYVFQTQFWDLGFTRFIVHLWPLLWNLFCLKSLLFKYICIFCVSAFWANLANKYLYYYCLFMESF